MAEPEQFNFSTEIRVRLPETDAFGIVFHANFFTYFDVARVDYLRNLHALECISPENGRLNVLVHANAAFRSPARFDDILVVHARISKFGRTSFTFEFLTFHKQENRVVADGSTVICVLDPDTWKPIPVPEDFREMIRNFEGERLLEEKS